MFNKEICMKNIKFLIKSQNKKIGDVEAKLGLRQGYLSRLSNDMASTNPNIELLSNIADILNVSLSILISTDMTSITETESLLINFIEDSYKKTVTGEYIWEEYSCDDLYNYDNYKMYANYCPIIKTEFDPLENMYVMKYYSKFTQNRMYLSGSAYLLKYIDKNIFIFKLDGSKYEMYLVDKDSINNICSTEFDQNKLFKEPLEQLYNTISKSMKHTHISDTVKLTIESMLKSK